MNYQKIQQIKKPYFTYRDISKTLGISLNSSRVTASRLAKIGAVIRIKRNLYVSDQALGSASIEDKFVLANLIQVPSYISLMTALSYYDITTQLQRDFIESIGYYRTKSVEIRDNVFNYSKINKDLYFGFAKLKGFFIASPEKAFLDAIYLKSFKKYNFDLSSIDFNKLDMKKIKLLIKKYPKTTKNLLLKYGYLKAT